MRFWMSAGRGGFGLSGADTLGSELYCIFYNGPYTEPDITKGWRVKPSPIPNKRGAFAELKSVNYLQNAMNLMEAQEAGFDQGIFMHADGTVCEGPNLNFAIIKDGIVRTPRFQECLAGCTMQRLLDLVPEYAAQGLLEGVVGSEQVRARLEHAAVLRTERAAPAAVRGASARRPRCGMHVRGAACMCGVRARADRGAACMQGPITVKDLSEADEAFMTGGSVPVMAVTQWDGRSIGDGTVGVQALALRQMILNDMIPRKGSDVHTEIPYGMLTGMTEDR